MRNRLTYLLVAFSMLFSSVCGDSGVHSHSVYMLVDTSGTYAREITKASKIINYLLATLNSGDSLAVAKAENRSYTEKDIATKVTFGKRPSQPPRRNAPSKKRFKPSPDRPREAPIPTSPEA